jgi:transposase
VHEIWQAAIGQWRPIKLCFATMWRDLNITKQDWERTPTAVRTVLLSLQQHLKLWESLWTFVRVEGVEPTNNNAERPLRRAVIWRRKSFGTQSESGSRFVERILTVVTTLRQQGRDVLGYLTTVCTVASVSASSPCLLSDSS